MHSIAGSVELEAVMTRLRSVRRVFHSEADLQHAFGQALTHLDPGMQVRLEIPVQSPVQGRSEHLDLLALRNGQRTAIEFKYPTAAWAGSVPLGDGSGSDELYRLKSHAAMDVARFEFVHDIYRLESAPPDSHGLAVLLTNVRGLWEPSPKRVPSRDHAFRIHEGVKLSGELLWGGGDYPPNTRVLRGSYSMAWHDFGDSLEGKAGTFRWLAVRVTGLGPPKSSASPQ